MSQNSRHTFLNHSKRERSAVQTRLVKQKCFQSPLQLFRFLSLPLSPSSSSCLSLFPAPDTPKFFFVFCLRVLSPLPRIAHTWRDGERRMEDACARHDISSFFTAFPPHFTSCKARGGLVVGRTDRRSKGVATGNANELHERRQIEQHTTIVTSCHPLASPRTHNRWSQRRATTNLIENCLCINTTAYVVINCNARLCGQGWDRVNQLRIPSWF